MHEFNTDPKYLTYLRDYFETIADPQGRNAIRQEFWWHLYPCHRYLGATYKCHMQSHFLFSFAEWIGDAQYMEMVAKSWIPSQGGLVYAKYGGLFRSDGHFGYQNRLPLNMAQTLQIVKEPGARKWATERMKGFMDEFETAAGFVNAEREKRNLDAPDGYTRWSVVLVLDKDAIHAAVGGPAFQQYRYPAGGAHVNMLMFFALPVAQKSLLDLGLVKPILPLPVEPAATTHQEKLNLAVPRTREFLEANARRKGVTTTASGLQYEVHREGQGESPAPGARVTVRYKTTRMDGKMMASTELLGEPSTFLIPWAIAGWREGIQLMKEGAKYRFVISPHLAYGDRGSPDETPIPPGEPAIVEMELLEVK